MVFLFSYFAFKKVAHLLINTGGGLLLIIFFFSLNKNVNSQTGWTQQILSSHNCLTINFPSKDTGYIIQRDGELYKTTNKGTIWLNMNTGIFAMGPGTFSTALLGIILAQPSKLTTNGGLSWTDVSNDLPAKGYRNINDQQFVNSNTGYYVGVDAYPIPFPCCYDGVIYKTTDSGLNWNTSYRIGLLEFHELYFIDENYGIVLDVGAFNSTTNGGITWYRDDGFSNYVPRFTARSMTDPFKDTIYVAGGRSDTVVVIKTTNRGDSWFLSCQLSFKSSLREINFVDNNVGYVVGDTGLIIKTTNGGENWNVINSGTRKRLNRVSFINKDTGFVVGDSGLVLTTLTGGLVSISQGYENVPVDYVLHQNFPNPFNPVTKIAYSLPHSSNIKITIYNSSGKEMLMVVNGFQIKGYHEFQFDGRDFSSGIYFYKLEAEGITKSKRMILLK